MDSSQITNCICQVSPRVPCQLTVSAGLTSLLHSIIIWNKMKRKLHRNKGEQGQKRVKNRHVGSYYPDT